MEVESDPKFWEWVKNKIIKNETFVPVELELPINNVDRQNEDCGTDNKSIDVYSDCEIKTNIDYTDNCIIYKVL